MRWGFIAERHGLPRLLTDPCVWGIGVSPEWDWRIWVGRSDALSSPPAGAYYPAQGVQQFPAGVPTAQVIVSQQPPIPPKRERKTVRSHLPPGTGGEARVQEGDSASPRCPRRAGWDVVQHAREGGGQRGAIPLDFPQAAGAQQGDQGAWWVPATLAVPAGGVVLSHGSRGGGWGCRGCQLLSAPGDAGARRPRMGPIYSGEPGGCRHGPTPGGRGCCWAGVGGSWHFLSRGTLVPLRLCSCCPGSRSGLGMGRTRPLAALCPPPVSQTHVCPPLTPPAECPVAPAASMMDTGPVMLRVYGLFLGWHRAGHDFCVLRLVPCAAPEARGCPRSPCASVVMPWDPPSPGGGHWPGDMALAPAAWRNGLQGSPCPMLSLPARHRDGTVSVGRCAPWGWEVAPTGPKLCMARVGTGLKRVSVGCWAQGKGVACVLYPLPC